MIATFLTTSQLIPTCDRDVSESGCGISFVIVRMTDLDFADDAVIFSEITGVLGEALYSLSTEVEPFGLSLLD